MDDIRALQSKDSSGLQKGLAAASLASWALPGLGKAVVSGGAKITLKMTARGLEHAAERHFVERGGAADASKFVEGTTKGDVQAMTASAVNSGTQSMSRGNIMFEHDLGVVTGTTNKGKEVTGVRALFSSSGDFLSAYPVKQ